MGQDGTLVDAADKQIVDTGYGSSNLPSPQSSPTFFIYINVFIQLYSACKATRYSRKQALHNNGDNK